MKIRFFGHALVTRGLFACVIGNAIQASALERLRGLCVPYLVHALHTDVVPRGDEEIIKALNPKP